MSKRRIPTAVSQWAKNAGRDYITPEDIGVALADGADPNEVRLEVLAHLGKQTEYGCEDSSLCAFIAFRGETDNKLGKQMLAERRAEKRAEP